MVANSHIKHFIIMKTSNNIIIYFVFIKYSFTKMLVIVIFVVMVITTLTLVLSWNNKDSYLMFE